MKNDKTGKTAPIPPEDNSEITHTRRIRGILVPTEKMVGKIREEQKDPTDSVIGKSR